MKMPDGGSRPAYNFQSATDTATQFIAGVAVETTGSDMGQLEPMVEPVEERSAKVPPEWLVDGGFAQHDQIDAVSAPEVGCTVYAPVPKPKDPKVDRHVPKPGDSAAVAASRSGWGRTRPRRLTRSGPRRPNVSTRGPAAEVWCACGCAAWPR